MRAMPLSPGINIIIGIESHSTLGEASLIRITTFSITSLIYLLSREFASELGAHARASARLSAFSIWRIIIPRVGARQSRLRPPIAYCASHTRRTHARAPLRIISTRVPVTRE